MSRIHLPRSLRWRLQLWQGLLAVVLVAGFATTVYQLQKLNRFRQIDAQLETRLNALTRVVRDTYHDAPDAPPPGMRRPPREGGRGLPPPPMEGPGPGGRRGPPPDDFGPGRGRMDDGPPPFEGPAPRPKEQPRPQPRPAPRKPAALTLPADATQLFGAGTGYYFVVWYRNGDVVGKSANAPSGIATPSVAERDTLSHFRARGEFREAIHCSSMGDCALAGASIQADLTAIRNSGWALAAVGAAVLALAFGLGWWLIGVAIRPIEDIGAAAARIAQGNLSERVASADPESELGRLAGVLNATFARLEAAFQRQQQFTADAAHELRTPLAILISEAQTTLAHPRSAAEYRETVESGLETAQQMRKITETLLTLARFGAGDSAVQRERVDLAEAAARGLERVALLAKPRGVILRAQLDSAVAFAVAERIDVVIQNLLTNAIVYNKPGGEVFLETSRNGGVAMLKVSDTGVGIAPADLAHIFDRFYRADKARSRAEGHAGLGLAITKAVVEAEHGTIEAASTVDKGSIFTVHLPAR